MTDTSLAAALTTLTAFPQRISHRLPIDEATIDDLCAVLGGTLDPAYEEFLRNNGGQGFAEMVTYDLPPGCPWGDWGILTELFGRFDDGRADLLVELHASRSVLGPGWLPIGRDPGGNLLLLRAAPGTGVWFWDHEGRPTGGAVTADDLIVTTNGERLYRIARTFTTFVTGLRAQSWGS
ncbi:MAG TPA: SMI1/KNR4 family protein [Microlunatus sp.]|nr:SMI1/KNR4 family protein [Microlunatus sp.]